ARLRPQTPTPRAQTPPPSASTPPPPDSIATTSDSIATTPGLNRDDSGLDHDLRLAATWVSFPAQSRARQLRVLGDELLRPDAVEVDGDLRFRPAPFHGQDRADAELVVPDAGAPLQLRRGAAFLRPRRANRRGVELHRRPFLEEREHAVDRSIAFG